MIEKVRPQASIIRCHDDDGWHEWDDIRYNCPKCGRLIRRPEVDIACDNCGTFYDWSKHARIKIIKEIEWI